MLARSWPRVRTPMGAAYHAKGRPGPVVPPPPSDTLIWGRTEGVMNKLLFGAATAAMLVAVSPAFAVDGECKEWGCPPSYERHGIPVMAFVQCHFVRQRITTVKSAAEQDRARAEIALGAALSGREWGAKKPRPCGLGLEQRPV